MSTPSSKVNYSLESKSRVLSTHGVPKAHCGVSLISAVTPQALVDRRITHIVSACTDAIPAHHPASGFHTYRIPVEDDNSSNMLIHLPAVCNFIHHAITHGGVVLVHCVQGLSRSACVVAAYCESFLLSGIFTRDSPFNLFLNIVMWSSRLSATDALSVVRRGKNISRYTPCNVKLTWCLPLFILFLAHTVHLSSERTDLAQSFLT